MAGSFWQFLEPERPLDCRSCHEILENSYMSRIESYRKFLTENLEKKFFYCTKISFLEQIFPILSRQENNVVFLEIFHQEDNIMKKFAALLLCAVSLSLIGCGGKAGLKNIDPSWTEPATAVTVFYTEPVVKNQDDVADDLPDFSSNFSGWFTQQMGSELKSQADIAANFTAKEAADFTMTSTKFGKKDYLVPSPKFDALDGVSGLIISMSNLEVSRLSETKMNPLTMSAETKSFLQFTGEYSIANADSKTVVASGTLKARVHLGFAMGKGDWEENMKNLVGEILKDTPLQKK